MDDILSLEEALAASDSLVDTIKSTRIADSTIIPGVVVGQIKDSLDSKSESSVAIGHEKFDSLSNSDKAIVLATTDSIMDNGLPAKLQDSVNIKSSLDRPDYFVRVSPRVQGEGIELGELTKHGNFLKRFRNTVIQCTDELAQADKFLNSILNAPSSSAAVFQDLMTSYYNLSNAAKCEVFFKLSTDSDRRLLLIWESAGELQRLMLANVLDVRKGISLFKRPYNVTQSGQAKYWNRFQSTELQSAMERVSRTRGLQALKKGSVKLGYMRFLGVVLDFFSFKEDINDGRRFGAVSTAIDDFIGDIKTAKFSGAKTMSKRDFNGLMTQIAFSFIPALSKDSTFLMDFLRIHNASVTALDSKELIIGGELHYTLDVAIKYIDSFSGKLLKNDRLAIPLMICNWMTAIYTFAAAGLYVTGLASSVTLIGRSANILKRAAVYVLVVQLICDFYLEDVRQNLLVSSLS